MTMTLLPSSTTATVLATINSMGVTTASISAPETDMKKGKQLHLEHIKQDQTTADLANSPSNAKRKQSIVKETPDVGILSEDFLKNNRQEEELSVHKQFTIHRKKQVAAADVVDVGILKRREAGGQQHPFDANLHAMNEVRGRSLQSEEKLPAMCPGKRWPFSGVNYFDNLFDETDGYFPKCSCPSPTTCGPKLCECLELNADGDILQCMDPFNQLCEGTKYIDGIPGPWSIEECLGHKFDAMRYCSMLPCFVDGGSYWQCRCQSYDRMCTEFKYDRYCSRSRCCQAQTDDEGRYACVNWRYENYYEEDTSVYIYISREEMISRFNECSFNLDSDKSIVQCYCESVSYGLCVKYGVRNHYYCEANFCCDGQTEDDARLDCFSQFRGRLTGYDFHRLRDEVQESCVASGRSSDQCKCDIQGLSNCVFGIDHYNREPRCDLFQCCQSQTGDNDDGKKDCLVQDEAQLLYEKCINYGNTTESCYCDKSTTLCTAGHSNGRHCELSSCCQEQTDDIGRKECIGNFTTSQPSSAPSETTPSPTATSISPGTSSASIPTRLGAKSIAKTTSKMLAVAAVIGWLLFS